jgi:hypothetical protein
LDVTSTIKEGAAAYKLDVAIKKVYEETLKFKKGQQLTTDQFVAFLVEAKKIPGFEKAYGSPMAAKATVDKVYADSIGIKVVQSWGLR